MASRGNALNFRPMNALRLEVLGLCGWVVLTGFTAGGQVVSVPKRLYGLGDLGPVAVSPDKRYLATGGESAAYLWDFETGTVQQRLDGHGSRITALTFTPDSQRLITGTRRGRVGIWSLDQPTTAVFLPAHGADINSIIVSDDGRSFATAGADNSAAVWSVEDAALVRRVTVPGVAFTAAVFTPDGRNLVTADTSPTNHVKLWDLGSGSTLRVFGGHEGTVHSVAILPDGRLATGGDDQQLRLWNLHTGDLLATLGGARGSIRFLVPVPNTTTLLGGCANQTVQLWETATGTALQSWPTEPLSGLVTVPDSDWVAVASSDLIVRLVDYQSGLTQRALFGHTTSTTAAVAFSPDGQFVASAGVEKLTRLWNRTNAHPVRAFEGSGAGSVSAAFSPDGRRLMTTTGVPRKSALLWNIDTGELDRELAGHTDWILAAAFSSDGRRIATGAQDRTLRVWDAATGQQLHSFGFGGAFVHCVAFSPDGNLVAGGGSSFDPTVRIWEVESGNGFGLVAAEGGSVRALAFSPSSRELVIAWEEGLIRVLDLQTGALLQELFAGGFVGGLALSPDGEMLLVAEGWPTFAARLIEWRTGRLLRLFAGHTAPVESVAFNAEGTQILTGADVVRLWDITDIAARLRAVGRPDGLELSWNLGTLQEASAPDGPWHTLSNAVSPWKVTITSPGQFFRVSASPQD